MTGPHATVADSAPQTADKQVTHASVVVILK